MVTAELAHNPYLLITKVKFNGQSPKINSQIEKYESQPLNNWVGMIPGIFYDEMNGYDFDLYFTGTVPDFIAVKSAFEASGVTSEQVRLFLKNEIEDSVTKSAEIDALLEWLRNHPNKKFNYDEFLKKNEELFEGMYPLIIIGGSALEKMEMSISPESVSNARELVNTDLTSTPIIFFVEESNRKQVRTDLNVLLNRDDIQQEQLFFMIDPALDVTQVTRVISDLGVTSPQIINSIDDTTVLEYVKNYPVTEYVRSVINIISGITGQIGDVLDKEKQESILTNAGVYQAIKTLDEEIGHLKAVDEDIVQRDYYGISQRFGIARQELLDQLMRWKKGKTKITGDSDSVKAASMYNTYINNAWNDFLEIITAIKENSAQEIEDLFSRLYGQAKIDTGYFPKGIAIDDINYQASINLTEDLLEEKEYEETKTDFFGLFRKASDNANEPVRELTYYLEKWRIKATDVILPIANAVVEDCYKSLSSYYNAVAEKYHEHLAELISDRTKRKETASTQLSDDEKRLQDDFDWLANVNEQLRLIERG